jgi:hypothetical protein
MAHECLETDPAPPQRGWRGAGAALCLLVGAALLYSLPVLDGAPLGLGGLAQAQARMIPAAARLGVVSPLSGFRVLLNGQPAALAANIVIRDRRNLIILPAALPAQSTVRYMLEASGAISRIWILTPEEWRAAQASSN